MKRAEAPIGTDGKPVGRRCAVCGKIGGSAMTMAITALREAGVYLAVPEERRYAHNDCVAKARRKLVSGTSSSSRS